MDFKNMEPTMDDLVCTILDPIHTKKSGLSLDASRFFDFLDDFKVNSENENGEVIYNIISRKPNGKYYVPEDKFNEFTDLLTICAPEVCIGETQQKLGSGLKLDFDVILNNDKINTIDYTKLISYLCSIIMNKTNYLTKPMKIGLNFLVLKKPEIEYNEEKNYYKDGYHIIFPTLKLSRRDKKCLIDFINNDKQYNKIINDMYGEFLVCKTNKVLDKMVCSNPIFFPRCRSKPNKPAYIISKIFNLKNLKITELNIFTFKNIIKDFSLNWNDNKDTIYELDKKLLEKYSNINTNKFINLNEYTTDDNKLNEIKSLLLLLDDSRYSYQDWVSILISIINHTNGDENAYKLFDEWSKDGKNYDENENRNIFDNFISKLESGIKYNYSIGTLKYFAKIDNPEKYNEFLKTQRIDNRKLYCDSEYYWYDFIEDMKVIHNSYKELKDKFLKNINKVMFRLHNDDRYIRKIDNTDFLCFDKSIPVDYFTYMDKSPKGKIFYKSAKLSDLVVYNNDKIQTYNRIVFKPYSQFHPLNDNDISNREFNSYNGIKANLLKEDEIDMSKIEMILNHIYVVWCNSNDDYYKYILSWFKIIFNNPQRKTKVAIVLKSQEKQIGKGIIINDFIIKYVFGDTSSLSLTGLDRLTGKFNTILMNKLFINCDELPTLAKNYHKQFELLKKSITDVPMIVEPKGCKSFTYSNYSNFIFCTNNDFSIKIEPGDCRYCIFECNPIYQKQYDYFTELANCFNSESADHFYSYISYYKDVVEIRNIPQTQLRKDMMISSLSSPCKFLYYLQKGLKDGIIELNEDEKIISGKLLYRKFKTYCAENNENICSNHTFGRHIKPYINKIRSNGSKYVIDSIKFNF